MGVGSWGRSSRPRGSHSHSYLCQGWASPRGLILLAQVGSSAHMGSWQILPSEVEFASMDLGTVFLKEVIALELALNVENVNSEYRQTE